MNSIYKLILSKGRFKEICIPLFKGVCDNDVVGYKSEYEKLYIYFRNKESALEFVLSNKINANEYALSEIKEFL